ncbi:hypothetical protein ACIBJF_25910 [Streptomyces sp. NPDC050743]|uniref:hypothetical protein n=1 Tax=Streptomyces sp. NPDC050743 TaxID=3365634 RepID=UPI0037B2A4D4
MPGARPVLLSARAAPTLALCLCALLGAAPGALATPAEWSIAPAGGGRPSFYAEGSAGTVLQDTVVVVNPGRAPVVVRLSGTGLRTVFAGEAGNGIRVPARTHAEVPFTVTVPDGAAPGDRSGAVVARDTRGRTATVPVRLRVGGPALAALTVEHLAVHADRITYELVNRGTTVLAPRLAVRADGVLGRVLDRAPRTLPVHLRPGARVKLTEPWPDRPALDAVDVRLTVTAPGGAHDTATTSARFVPWPTVAGGALFAGAVAAFAVRRRRRPTHSDDPTPSGSTPGVPAPDGPASSRVASSDPVTPGTPVPDGPASRLPSSDPVTPGSPAAPEGPVTGPPTTGVPKPGRPTPSGSTPGIAAPHGPAAQVCVTDSLTTGSLSPSAPPPEGLAPEGAVTDPLATGVPKPGRAMPDGPSARPALGASKHPEPVGRPPTRTAPGGVRGAVAAGVPYLGGELTEGAVK